MDSQQPPDHDPSLTPPAPANGGPPLEEPIDDAQLSPRAWVARNGPTLLLALAALVAIYYKFGLEGMWTIAKVAVGLGAVVFIHELGHFLVAKWCDVHVQTFSIGFGPALPGCIYRWGETTYKIALFPLGGYVKMVGEGGENDEEDTDPRSYKNKSVGQRMAIISAGVVMNVLFGLVMFIIAFKIGVHQHSADVGVVEAGGPAWKKGVRSGDVLERIGGVSHPYWEDLKVDVMLAPEGRDIDFVFVTPGQEPRELKIEPRKTKNEANPVIGVTYPMELKLLDKRDAPADWTPAARDSAAAAARALDLKPGDVLLAATDTRQVNPAEGPALPTGLTDLERIDPAGDLGMRLLELAGKDVKVRVRRAGKEEEITLPADSGFQLGDRIVGTTDPDEGGAADPFRTAPLRTDPRDPQGRHLDYFQFLERLARLAGRPVVIQVQRKGAGGPETVNIFVPPSYHRTVPGMRMQMGAVKAVRDGSDAQAKGVRPRDVITGVTLTDAAGQDVHFASLPDKGEQQLDPLRLPHDLRQWAAGRSGVKASLKVRREQGHQADAVAEINDLKWDDSWRHDMELPLGADAALAVPELGIAYHVNAQVAAVDHGSYADEKKLRPEDFIVAWSFPVPEKGGQGEKWGKPVELGSKDNPTGTPYPGWANVFYVMQSLPLPRVKLLVKHADGGQDEVELELRRDVTWPLFDPLSPRGLHLRMPEDRIARADSLGGAVHMGMRYTYRTIAQIYMSLRALATQRVSATENLQGPIDIAVYAYEKAGHDWADFLLLLGLISVNLAVVNFLPIPILDGGHMVFLIYEKLRGRPASEHVRLAANWVGLLLLASLMIFVIYLGVSRWIWPLVTG